MSDWGFINRHRVGTGPYANDPSMGFNGMAEFALSGEARRIRVIFSDGMGWQHVSVSFGPDAHSCPSWALMCRIKELFWEPEDVVVQFHPAKSAYVNFHPHCLHLWRCTDGREQPVPPSICVGPKTNETLLASTEPVEE